jgi:ferredoxin
MPWLVYAQLQSWFHSHCHSAGYADYMQFQEFQEGLKQLLQEAEAHCPAAYMCAEMVSRAAAAAATGRMRCEQP